MNAQIELEVEPQWRTVYRMLRGGPKTTNDFCNTPGLAAEYRRAKCDLERKLIEWGDKERIQSRPLTRKNWEYRLVDSPAKGEQ